MPLTFSAVDVYRVTAAGAFNLKRWTGSGGASYRLSVNAGVVTSSTGSIY